MPYSTWPNALTHVLHTDDAQQYTFRYLQNPDSETWLRGGSAYSTCPHVGDFVVLQLDPGGSVAHLDATARRAAKAIRPRKYVAFILQGFGIPLDTKPTNPHDILLVRRGIAPARKPPFDTSEMCIPILPNTSHPRSRNAVRPVQPLRWPDCYLDTTFGFPVSCRVTTVSRDYTPVLPVNIPDLIKLRRNVREDKKRVFLPHLCCFQILLRLSSTRMRMHLAILSLVIRRSLVSQRAWPQMQYPSSLASTA
ncbi:hypothetical protein PENSPDRAFT_471359 [Peniophora sp. CONT]|nr:hypothetical protein PENSPDRAFT_471359 [Peniophora sp. CONT]